ncbi:MAG TPA: competence/damage-inducible protein A [Tepidisphaeraceae bacterium]|nr:competence/damage-inducible protein A [Tepidisphaeraceae bacterium]
MRASILSIGDELVLGQTLDTNTQWIARQLAAVGCDIGEHRTVGDDQRSIEIAIQEISPRCNFLFISGGLGPTDDDLTRQAVAKVAGVNLQLSQEWLDKMIAFFAARKRPMVDRNRIQAMLPTGCTMLDNPNGTACGFSCSLPAADCTLFCMPGVPKEMKPMFTEHVLPAIRKASGGAVILQRTLHTFGAGESQVAEMLGDLMDRKRNPSVGTTVSNNVVSLRINARAPSPDEGENAMRQTIDACRDKLGELIYGTDDDSLASAVAKLLTNGAETTDSRSIVQTVTTAESCTGGLIAKYLTDIPGSSAYFKQGFIVYSNQAKTDRLGVSENIIHVHGAVSEPVVIAMAKHARRLTRSDYALAVSGIAGPDGGSAAKPVGTVCVGLAHLPNLRQPGFRNADREEEVFAVARTFNFPGDRDMVRDRAAKMALAMLRYRLLGVPMPF